MRPMRAAGIDAFGDDVRLLELAAPESAAPDEVVISVHAAGVASWDELVRVGEWDVGRRPPLVLGVEAAGVVTAVGEDVTSFVPGDEVLTHPVPLRRQGAWAEWLVAPAALVAPKPAPVPRDGAAAFPLPALTVDQALTEVAPAPAWEWILVHGAGGVTGGLTVQLAVAQGATVVATAGPASAARVRDYGALSSSTITIPPGRPPCETRSPGRQGVEAGASPDVGSGSSSVQAEHVAFGVAA